MVPLIQTVQDAQNVVKFSKFPPRGTRGLGSPFSMEKFSPGLTQVEYLQQANDATLVVLQIETASALAHVDEIAAVEGVDVLLIGPYDLGNSIGHPILAAEMDSELHDAIAKIHAAAQGAGKFTAIFCGSGEVAKGYAGKGFNMVNVMTDVGALGKGFGGAVDVAGSGT